MKKWQTKTIKVTVGHVTVLWVYSTHFINEEAMSDQMEATFVILIQRIGLQLKT
jgi:hypothetical protein